jgi:hypothetical protein
MPKIKPPCIRNLKAFKDGCPGCSWDGEEGCLAWVEMPYDNEDPSKPPVIVKACIDLVSFDIQLKMLRLLEGNQQATESLRNGLCETVDGKIVPKPDPAATHLIMLLTNSHNKKMIEE